MSTTPAATTRGTSQNLVIAVLALIGVTSAFMQTILVPLQSRLPELVDASPSATSWAITATLLVAAICTPIAGRLGDLYGKRRVILVLIGLLVIGSVVGAMSSSVAPLIVGRGLQGAGMGAIPLAISMLREVVDADRLPGATALVSSTLGVGGALGLPLSALITQNADWHIVFWAAAALGSVAFVLTLLVVPSTTSRPSGSFDYLGAAGLSAALATLLLALSQGSEWGWSSTTILALFASSVALFILWGWWELRTAYPLVNVRTTLSRPVLLTNLASIAIGFALFANSVVFPQLSQLPEGAGGLGLSLISSALLLMPSGIVMLVMSPIAGRLEKRIGAKMLLMIGALIVASAYLVAIFLASSLQPWQILIINPLVGIGVGLGYAAMPTLIMKSVPASETGSGISVNTLMRSLGTSLASALIAGILTSRTQSFAGTALPTVDAFKVALSLGLLAGVIAAVVTLFIGPARRSRTTAPSEQPSTPVTSVS